MRKLLTIQIVGWNSAAALPKAIAALKNIPTNEVEIIYIDNGSRDNSVALVREQLPHAKVMLLGHNTGFTGAHNHGFSVCQTEFVMLHNPDLVIYWKAVKELLQAFAEVRIAAVQGKLLRTIRPGQPAIFDSAGIVLTSALNGRERGAGEEDTGQYDQPMNIAAVTGACAIYRLSALQRVDYNSTEYFDEDFFAYKEDVDLGWRLTKAGFTIRYVPVIQGIHDRAVRAQGFMNWGLNLRAIAARLRSPRTRYSLRNWVWMVVKNASPGQLLLHSIPIGIRLSVFFVFSLIYPPLLRIWPEIAHSLPRMLVKRRQGLRD